MLDTAPMTSSPPVAVVTGAGSATGIGFAVARRLAAAGHRLVIAATTDRIHERAADLGAEGFVGDLTDPAVAQRLIDRAVECFGTLHVLVNNAGMTALTDQESPGAIDDIGADEWHRAIARNLDTAFFVTRAAVPVMRRKGYGRIVTVGSVSGPVAAYPRDVGYHAAKAGLLGLTRSAALDTARDGITVNVVAPGWIATGSSGTHELASGAATPVGRSGTADEVAALVCYLAGPDAGYVTGQQFIIDGGNSIIDAHS